jgi:hypothetical protein
MPALAHLSMICTGFNEGTNLLIYNNCLIDIRNIHFGPHSGTPHHIACGIGSVIYGGQWNVNNTFTISDDGYNFINCSKGSTMGLANCVITLAGTPNFSDATISSSISSSVTFGNYPGYTPCAWSGGASGARFTVDGTSALWTGTGDVNWIPGDQPGNWVNNNLQGNYA